MIQCSCCHHEIAQGETACSQCGAPVQPNGNTIVYNHNVYYPQYRGVDEPDLCGNFIGWCFPLIGLIGYFTWKTNTPHRARSLRNWLIFGWVCKFIIPVCWYFLMVFLSFATFMTF